MRALEETEERLKDKEAAPALPVPPNAAARISIPIVRNAPEDGQRGMLTARQRAWTESFPNEPYVENPVLYK